MPKPYLEHSLSTKSATNLMFNLRWTYTFIGPSNWNLFSGGPWYHYNCHIPSLFEHFSSKEDVWAGPSGKKVPLGERGENKSGLDGLKEWWGTTWCPPLLVLCPATQRDQWVSCSRSMVMEECRGFFVSQPVGRTQNAIMLVARRGTSDKTYCYTFPQMATA